MVPMLMRPVMVPVGSVVSVNGVTPVRSVVASNPDDAPGDRATALSPHTDWIATCDPHERAPIRPPAVVACTPKRRLVGVLSFTRRVGVLSVGLSDETTE